MASTDDLDEPALVEALGRWALGADVRVQAMTGGMNARVWRVMSADGDFVAKLAWDRAPFEAGLAIAEQLEQCGFSAGGPMRLRDGNLVVRLPQGTLGLLRFVAGDPLSGAGTTRVWGGVMARLHRALLDLPLIPPGLPRWPWPWLDPQVPFVAARPWLQTALRRALSEAQTATTADALRLGLLHGDGAPVILDPATGRTSVIDWGAAMWGPLLYDIASAYWFSVVEPGLEAPAFEPFVAAYRAAGVIADHEWPSLPAFVRLRAAVQAFYFAWRCDNDVLVGHGREQNQAKLGDARRFLEAAFHEGSSPIG